MKVIHKVNSFFFPELDLEEDKQLAISDYLFYGQFVIYLLIASVAII